MQDSKSIYSKCFTEYRLSDEQLKKLQQELLSMLVDVKSVCDKYQIEYMLGYGTLIGAVRHQGFIPWDDDIDLMMLRSEFERFKEIFCREFPGKYEVVEPLSDPHYVSKMVKIYKKGTVFIEIPTASVGGPDMIFIDLFIVDNVLAPGWKQKLKRLAYKIATRASSVCVDYQYPSEPVMEKCKTNRELKKYYYTRRALGFVFSHLGGMRFYLKLCEDISRQKKVTGWLGTPATGDYIDGAYPERIFKESTEIPFCGYMMKAPKYYDEYLRIMFGDYMQIPPPEKREYHAAYKIKFSDGE